MDIKEYIMEKLSKKMERSNIETLFSSVDVIDDGEKIRFSSYDEIFLQRIKLLFEDDLNYIFKKEKGDNFDLEFKIVSEEEKKDVSRVVEEINIENSLEKNFKFENYVIGRSNEMAYSAAMAVAQSYKQPLYNPLFIYGDSGLGKTHLINAIGNKVLQYKKNAVVYYVTADKFRNELIEAIQKRTTGAFREKYRKVDLLLIDDIHVIEKSEAVQEEMFHTFNDLYKVKKQIVITSDRPPAEINIEKRLITRFEWGLVTDIKQPDLETRAAIIRKKVDEWSMKLSDDIILYLAENITSSVRKIEGALRRIQFYKKIAKTTHLNRSDVTALLGEFFDNNLKDINVDSIKKMIADYFGITVKMLEGKRRKKEIVIPRFIAMYLSRKYTNETLKSIGAMFGGRDHAAVINACNRVENMMKEDIVFKNEVDKIVVYLNNGGRV